jgi:predicted HAD superfamily hydrolase
MNSWDCFDTLIARNYKTPISIFNIISNKINDPTFVDKRIAAEKFSLKKTYLDIYKLLPEYDPQIELDVEKEYSFPILENFNRVKDGDIIISDMYLSSDQILDLLQYHGFNKDVEIFVTYNGKHSGHSWNYLKNKYPNVQYHFGDNMHSDIINARQHGIESVFSAASLFTPEENFIAKNDFALATLMRRLRLSNPYFRPKSLYIHKHGSFQNIAGHLWIEEINGHINHFKMHSVSSDHFTLIRSNVTIFVKIYFNGQSFYSQNLEDNYMPLYEGSWKEDEINYTKEFQRLLWIDQSQFNLPILCLVSSLLPKNKKIVFSQRDCFYLYTIFKHMFPKINCCMLDVSRNGYYNPYNFSYIDYIKETTKNSLVVDSHGSGASANTFFKNNGIPFELYHICKHPVRKNQIDNNILSSSHICKNKFLCCGRFLEQYNVNYLGPLSNWHNGPIRDEPEHDKVACETISECIHSVCKYINYYTISNNPQLIPHLLNKLQHTFTQQFIKTIGA